MNVIHAHPPNIDAIDAAFNVRNRPGVVYTFGDTIYVPSGGRITPELAAHEEVHSVQQRSIGVHAWWEAYIRDAEFRLAQELPAHNAEYRRFCKSHADPNKRARFLFEVVAARLAGPIYGGIITQAEARKAIEAMR